MRVFLIRVLMMLVTLPAFADDALTTFRNGEVADADAVNENFTRLLERIEALENELAALEDVSDFDLDGFSPAAGDCDDSDPGRYPGADELCDGVDNDCDGTVDNGATAFCEAAGLCSTASCVAGSCVNTPKDAGTVCRANFGTCNPAETCDGSSLTCPPDAVLPEGTVCGAMTACTLGLRSVERCSSSGVCLLLPEACGP